MLLVVIETLIFTAVLILGVLTVISTIISENSLSLLLFGIMQMLVSIFGIGLIVKRLNTGD